jgi:hypothetical protein
VKRKEAVAIYRAGQEPVVKKLCELSAKIDEQAKKIASPYIPHISEPI